MMREKKIEQEQYYHIAEQDCFVDMSECFRCNCGQCCNITGPRKTGKSMLLSALRCYYDQKYDSAAFFDHAACSEREPKHWERNKHPVLFLDFSDFAATNITGALRFFRAKMSALYLEHMECFEACWSPHSAGVFLDMIEGKSTRQNLQRSLLEMVYLSRRSGNRNDCPLILIDEAGKPLLYAAKYGYLNQLMPFYDAFLEIDHYELTFGIMTTSYAPIDTDVPYSLKYLRNKPIHLVEPCRRIAVQNGIVPGKVIESRYLFNDRRFFHREISLKECFNEMVNQEGFSSEENNSYPIVLPEEAMVLIAEKRAWIVQRKREDAVTKRKQKIQSRKEYAVPLPEECEIPSAFAGVRELNFQVRNQERYDQMNHQLVDLYDQYGKDISQSQAYLIIQGVRNEEEKYVFPDGYLTDLKTYAEEQKNIYRVHSSRDENWLRLNISRHADEPGYSDLALVKSYLSVADDMNCGEVFQQVVRFLIDFGIHRFHAKIARRKRSDHICLWTAREDFFRLEDYLQKSKIHLMKPLPFVAYRGEIGISREMFSWKSYNGVISGLIRNYLAMIDHREEISLLDMYALYVRAWNGDLAEDHPFTIEYKPANAQELLILLETLNVMVGGCELTDDHLLLNGNQKLWYALGQAKNWFEVGMKLKA